MLRDWKDELFVQVCLLSLIVFIVLLPLNLWYKVSYRLSMFILIDTIVAVFLLIMAVFYGRTMKSVWITTALGTLIVMWFAGGGIKGTVPYYFLLPFLFVVVFYEGWKQKLLFALIVFEILFLYFIETHGIVSFLVHIPTHIRTIHIVVSVLLLMFISAFFVYMALKGLHKERKIVEIQNERLKEATLKDSLTNLYNHESILKELGIQVKRAQRYKESLSLFMFDIDGFKEINDVYGHLIGDEVLRKVANALMSVLRKTDIAGRYGGDEFLVVLPETGIEGAKAVAEKVRNAIRKIVVGGVKGVTISGGITEYRENSNKELIKEVDELLYRAKAEGKDRIEER